MRKKLKKINVFKNKEYKKNCKGGALKSQKGSFSINLNTKMGHDSKDQDHLTLLRCSFEMLEFSTFYVCKVKALILH